MIPALKPTKGSIIKRLPSPSLLYPALYLAAVVGLVLVNNHHNIFYHHQTFQKQFGKILHTYDKHNFLTALFTYLFLSFLFFLSFHLCRTLFIAYNIL